MIVRSFERRAQTINPRHPGDPGVYSLFGLGGATSSGVDVSPETAMRHAAVFACVRVRAETLGSVPLHFYRRAEGGGREAIDYPLSTRPNPEMTAPEFWEAMGLNLELRGNAIAQVVRDGTGRPIELWPIPSNLVTLTRAASGELVYGVQVNGAGQRHMRGADVLHIRNFGTGIWGMSPIENAAESIGASIATERFGARFFSNDATPGLVVSSPKAMNPTTQQRLRESVSAAFAPMEKKHRVMVLEEGMTANRIGIEPNHAQFLETRKFHIRDIARIFRLPPHLIQDLENATFSNISEQSLEFVKYSMLPVFRKAEEAMHRTLLSEAEQRTTYARFNLEGLLRGDPKTRAEYYRTLHGIGSINADEIRALEELNPIEDGSGRHYFVPLNMIPSEMAATMDRDQRPASAPQAAPAERAAPQAALDLGRAFGPVLVDASRRSLRCERRDVVREARERVKAGDLEGLADWICDYYAKHEAMLTRAYEPGVLGAAACLPLPAPEQAQRGAECLRRTVAREAQASVERLLALVRAGADGLVEAIEAQFEQWEQARPTAAASETTADLLAA